MKLLFNFLLGFLFLSLLFIVPSASAQYYGGGFWYGTEQVIDSVVQNLEPLFRALLGGYDWSGYLLFEKVLLFILFSIIVGLILEKLPVFERFKSKKILRLVAVIIGILSVRNLNYIWVGTILVQYQVLFIAIAGILPFLIYFYFVKSLDEGNSNSWVRKTAWVFYAVIYFGLWATTELEAYSAVYLWGAIVALIYGFVIDKSVQDYLLKLRNKEAHNRNIYLRNSELRKNIYDLQHQKSIIQNEKEIKSIEKEIVRLDKLIDDNERRIK
ncbi:hypothetical protein J4416_04825 [Candidatus Pacearchaeota archaeon]|nr:hypothetical protein [Candidatus Pacearchaeota archaeon]